ncbi:hypothetical protein V6N13_096765 [Hibiscus sabdariffa]
MVREAKGKRKKVAKSKGIGKTKPKGKEALKPKGVVSKDGKCFHSANVDIGKETARFILKISRRLKQLEHQFQGLHTRRNLAKGDVDLRVGNGATVAALAEFKNEVQNQHGKSIKVLRSDRGGEYLSQDFDELLKECGIVSQLTPPGTQQWNGVSERRNRTLLDMVRSMMSHTDLPTSFWGYALETTAFTLN